MCQQSIYGPYPCGHIKTTWDYCAPARARSLLRNNPCQAPSKIDVAPCAKPLVIEFPADLETACPRTCLTKPFRCCKCLLQNGGDDNKQQNGHVGWTCKDCGHVRCCIACTVMAGCDCARCHGALCRELVPQRVGDDSEGKTPQACQLCTNGACMWDTKDANKHQVEGVWWKCDEGRSQGK
ncbi:hypothetical protein PG996_006828 [Apiospora saccharicola]|uniref:Uncharacterized protein n=1 Tax=Apiospora saccharicola TaxID=335842 RepID=A0ABR1VBK3_9PEZI